MRKQEIFINGVSVKDAPSSMLVSKGEGLDFYKNYLDEIVDGKYIVDFDAETKIDKDVALNDANTEYENKVKSLTNGVPESEISTWTKQEAEARAWLLDNSISTPLITSLATARGVEKSILVNKIIEKADAYAVAIGTLTGVRQKLEDLIQG